MLNKSDLFSEYFKEEYAVLSRWKKANIILTIAFVSAAIFQSMNLVAVIGLLLTGFGEMWRRKHRSTSQERLLKFIDSIEFDWDVLSSLDVDDESMGRLHQAFIAAQFTGMSHSNIGEKRNRGADEKGPALSDHTDEFDRERTRVDPSEHEEEYEGLEGPLRPSEHLLRDADLAYAKQAEERWNAAESKDIDLVEAGVERLGDLVGTGWFEKNAQDGAVSDLMKSDDTQ